MCVVFTDECRFTLSTYGEQQESLEMLPATLLNSEVCQLWCGLTLYYYLGHHLSLCPSICYQCCTKRPLKSPPATSSGPYSGIVGTSDRVVEVTLTAEPQYSLCRGHYIIVVSHYNFRCDSECRRPYVIKVDFYLKYFASFCCRHMQ